MSWFSGLGSSITSDLTAVANAWTTAKVTSITTPAPTAAVTPVQTTAVTPTTGLMAGGVTTILLIGGVLFLIAKAMKK